jgi:UDP-N-acetylmuramoyl-L-alanyl-D-glutamate--2,6-diaminopimelate ligase
MKLKKLIAGMPITIYRGAVDADIAGVGSHSKMIAPGHLFIAKKGSMDDGSKYIEQAIHAGAGAILTDLPNPFLIKGIVQLIHPLPGSMEAPIAARFYNNPSQELFMVGITGTNGKTTTSYLVKHLLDHLGYCCGLIGTIEYLVGSYRFVADRTTP